MNHRAIIVGVSNYIDTQLEDAKFSAANAEAVSNAFTAAGIPPSQQMLLTDKDANSAAVGYAVLEGAERVAEDATLYFYFSGYGFSSAGENYLACYNTQLDDADDTSLRLEMLLDNISRMQCQVVLLLDGVDQTPLMREHLKRFKTSELEDRLDDFDHCLCLTSCKAKETSHAPRGMKRSVWTHHLVEAISGEAGLALPLQGVALQQHLQVETPRTLTRTISAAGLQSPQIYGNPELQLVAASQPLLSGEPAPPAADDNLYEGVSLRSETYCRVRDLPGWKRTYRVPDKADDANNAFIARLVEKELTRDLDNVFSGLKKAFAFKRRDVEAPEPAAGAGSILTPYFNYSIAIILNPDDPSEAIWTRRIDAIRQPEQLTTKAFETVFENAFDTIDCTFPAPVDVEAFIDGVEDAELPDLTIDYDREATYCNLELRGAAGELQLTAVLLSITHPASPTTAALVESYETIRSFVSGHGLPLQPLSS